jgi:putative membrane protein
MRTHSPAIDRSGNADAEAGMRDPGGGRRSGSTRRPGLVVVVLAVAAACGGSGDTRYRAVAAGPIRQPPVIPPVVTTLAPAETPVDLLGERTAHLSAAQVISVAAALNAGEIAMAQMALPRAVTKDVQGFARVMVRDHGQALRQVTAAGDSTGGAAAPTALLEHTGRAGQQAMMELQPLHGRAFDRAYIDGQVKMHQAALDLIDQRLLPGAKDALLQATLREMRGTVSEHLQVAIQVRAKLED